MDMYLPIKKYRIYYFSFSFFPFFKLFILVLPFNSDILSRENIKSFVVLHRAHCEVMFKWLTPDGCVSITVTKMYKNIFWRDR